MTMESPLPDGRFAYAPAIDRALALATVVHRGQTRKGTNVPYVVHPMHVAFILERHGYGEPFVIAALLHDVLEDARTESTELRADLRQAFPFGFGDVPEEPRAFLSALDGFLTREFGMAVMRLVRGVTDQKEVDGRKLPTAEKRARKLDELRGPGVEPDVLALKAADAIHNARSTAHDLGVHGFEVMARFKTPPAETLQWYKDVRDVAAARLGDHPIVHELADAVRDLARQLARLSDDLGKAERFLDV